MTLTPHLYFEPGYFKEKTHTSTTRLLTEGKITKKSVVLGCQLCRLKLLPQALTHRQNQSHRLRIK